MADTAYLNNTPNYLGMLFEVNRKKTQFLSLIGGTEGRNAEITTTPQFPITVNYELGEASQPKISEVDAMGAAKPEIVGKTQTENVIQIFQRDVAISHMRQRATGVLSGVVQAGGTPDAADEEAFQIMAQLEKMKEDMNYTAINGKYNAGGLSSENTALGTRGIIEAIKTNTVQGALDGDSITELIRLVHDNGRLDRPVIFANSKNRVKISRQFLTEGLTEVDRDRTAGGVAVSKIVTEFGEIYLATDNGFPDDKVVLVDLDYVKPVFTRHNRTGEIISVIPHPQRGGFVYEIYAEFGLNHGDETLHGMLEISDSGETESPSGE